jgi:glycerophosphoryl diester phosphodiesterase
MHGTIRTLTTRTAFIMSSLLVAACSQTESQKVAGEEEPSLQVGDVGAGVAQAVRARPPSTPRRPTNVQLGPRPYYLVEDMDDGPLKSELQRCSEGPFHKTDFSIGHRGAGLQFPEHTKESYEAAAREGAGIIECDVTFTKDRQLVCHRSASRKHDQHPFPIPALAAKCTSFHAG